MLLNFSIFEIGNCVKKTPQPVLFLLHGLFGSKKNFESIAKFLSQNANFKVITIDARNHGESSHDSEFNYFAMAKDVEELMSHLNISSANILGHSMGGKTAMTLALTKPNLVNSLIVEDIAPTSSPAIDLTISNDTLDFHQLVKMMKKITFTDNCPSISDARKYAHEQLKDIVKEKSVRDFLVTNIKENSLNNFTWRLNLESIDNNLNNVYDFPDFKSLYNGPTMFVAGQNSNHIKLVDQKTIFQLFPKAYTVYVEGAGHWIHSEKQNEFLYIIIEFFKTNKISQ